MKRFLGFKSLVILVLSFLISVMSFARSSTTAKTAKKDPKISESAAAKKRIARAHHRRATVRRARSTPRRRAPQFSTSSFAADLADNDDTAGEDPIVRKAAVQALGNMNGTVVAIDPNSGRILTMVNQKLALSGGAQPCSTIKVAVALAALSEKAITSDTEIKLSRWQQMNLTQALAKSNNAYFETVGRKLGFKKISYYAHQFGLGELAGFNLEGEHLGVFPAHELPAKLGGVGKMCSFGESISMTPLQLGALLSAVANGGTLYYLQHPDSPEDVKGFEPKIKRQLAIGPAISEMEEGMGGAVEYGTARRLRENFIEEQILGKTGTCSKGGTRYGWFASYANTDVGRIVTVVFLQGGRPTYGPKAAEITGKFYRNLYDHNFFAGPVAATSGAVPEKAANKVQR